MELAGRVRNMVRQYNSKKFAMRLLMCIGIGIVAVLVLPIVISLAVVTGILILVRLVYERKSNKVVILSENKRGDIFDLISPMFFSMFRGSSINENYYCANCRTKHKEIACPSCGSKFKKIIGS
jgi:hypothetical protein